MSEDMKFMMEAFLTSELSLDPSTQVGCVIVSKGEIVARGFNHVPSRIRHSPEMLLDRSWKYPRVIHAEQHALSQIAHGSYPIMNMYVTHYPCERCAAQIIHAGMRRVITHEPSPEILERWSGMKISMEMMMEANITVTLLGH